MAAEATAMVAVMVAVMVAATAEAAAAMAEAAAIDLCQRRQAAQSILSAPPPCAGRWHAHGARGLRAIAAELNNRGIPTATGTGSWQGSPLKAKRELGAHRTAATIVVLASSGGGLEHSVAAGDDGKLISWPVRIAVAVAVFSLGILVGAAVAAWVVPPT
jgi:hypothetical protein